MNVKTRNVSLTPENDLFITGCVASGRFGSASEVVRAALRLLEEDERRRQGDASPDDPHDPAARAAIGSEA